MHAVAVASAAVAVNVGGPLHEAEPAVQAIRGFAIWTRREVDRSGAPPVGFVDSRPVQTLADACAPGRRVDDDS